MTQPLTSSRFPYLPIEIGIVGTVHQLEALVDTGFSGQAILPLRLQPAGVAPDYVVCELGDGSLVRTPVYPGSVRVAGVHLDGLDILVMGDEPIIGRGVMPHFTIILDHAQRLIVQP